MDVGRTVLLKPQL